jgi:hypothetical protein
VLTSSTSSGIEELRGLIHVFKAGVFAPAFLLSLTNLDSGRITNP